MTRNGTTGHRGEQLGALADDPRPDEVMKLTDVSPPICRVSEGDRRILYVIEDNKLVVLIVRIAHRSEAYR